MNYLKRHANFKIANGRHEKDASPKKSIRLRFTHVQPKQVQFRGNAATAQAPHKWGQVLLLLSSLPPFNKLLTRTLWRNLAGTETFVSTCPRPNRSIEAKCPVTARALVGLLQRTSSIFLARWWRCQTKTYKSWVAWSTRSQGCPCRLQPCLSIINSYGEVSHTWFLRVWISRPTTVDHSGFVPVAFCQTARGQDCQEGPGHCPYQASYRHSGNEDLLYCKWFLQAFYLSKSSLLVHHQIRYLKKNLKYPHSNCSGCGSKSSRLQLLSAMLQTFCKNAKAHWSQ